MPSIVTINLIQRLAAMFALGFLTVQIYIDRTNTPLLVKNIVKYLTYLLIFIQPLFIIFARYVTTREIDPFYMYTDLCVLCDGRNEYYTNFLRIAFYAVTVALFFPLLKLKSKLYNQIVGFGYYVGFYALSLYLYNTGPVTPSKLFIYFFWMCQVVVLVSIFKKFKEVFKPKLKV